MTGYVRIHRTLLEHPAFRNEAEAMAFAWLVAKAAWRTTRARYKGHDIILERGQLSVSIRDFADKMDRPKGWVERLFARLREHGMIEQKNGTGVGTRVGTHGGTDGGTPASVITICKYDDYQGEGLTRETLGKTLNETFTGQQPDTEQVREEGKKEEANASSPRAWACPPNVDPAHWRDFLKNRKTRRLTNTETAYHGQLRELEKLTDDEWPPGRLVEYAAAKGWGSINDPRTPMNGASNVRELRRPGAERPGNPLDSLYRLSMSGEPGDPADGDGTRLSLPPAKHG